MKVFENSKWIWIDEDGPDLYAEFYDSFEAKDKPLFVNISADSDYTLFINGRYVASNQYGDFEYYKIYDTIDISSYVTSGTNKIAILAWHFGEVFMRHYKQTAGIIYEIVSDSALVLASGTGTRARKSRAYMNGRAKKITSQLGFSFGYDARLEDNWINGEGEGFSSATLSDKKCEFYPRPIEKHRLLNNRYGKLIKKWGKNRYLYDLGEETVGLLSFSLDAKTEDTVTVSWGEHIIDGSVRRIISDRDFSIEYRPTKGHNEYTNYMLRFAGRYIEISSESAFTPISVSLIPCVYPTKKRDASFLSGKDKLIYDLSLNTLELCMMEHYVDCPWREQCLYAFDSRNQMLSGYYAFRDGNFNYARANLKLLGMDRREDKILSICSPTKRDFTIPSFSLHFVVALWEYTKYSSDISLALELDEKVRDILDAFLARRREDGLIACFATEAHWNFYDWSEGSDGYPIKANTEEPDAVLNLLAVRALEAYKRICRAAKIEFPYRNLAREITSFVRMSFLDKKTGLFIMKKSAPIYTELVNSLAIITGAASKKEAKSIAEKMAKGELIELSLSMRTIRYDAYIKVDKDAFRDKILGEIREDYGKMLDEGATSVWETVLGAADFKNAGSLCHGWSSIPIYYYNLLLK